MCESSLFACGTGRPEFHCKFRLSQNPIMGNLRYTFHGIFQMGGDSLFFMMGREVSEWLSFLQDSLIIDL